MSLIGDDSSLEALNEQRQRPRQREKSQDHSSKLTLNTVKSPVKEGEDLDTPAYSSFRKTRTSLLLNSLPGADNSKISAKEDSSFKKWYTTLLKEADLRQEAYSKTFPQRISLDALFGLNTDAFQGADKLIMASSKLITAACAQNWKTLPSSTKCSSPDPPIRFLDENAMGKVKGIQYEFRQDLEIVAIGTCNQLLDALIFPLDQDSTYQEVFLASYRFFTTATEVYHALYGWLNVQIDPKKSSIHDKTHSIQLKAIKVMLCWMKNYWLDFHQDPNLFAQLSNFMKKVEKVSFNSFQQMKYWVREQKLSCSTLLYVPVFLGSSEIAASLPNEWDPRDFAENLTAIEHYNFRLFKPEVYFNILHIPASTEGGYYNLSLKIFFDITLWFRIVLASNAVSFLYCKMYRK